MFAGMESYPINFYFRSHNFKAQVHKHTTHYHIWFTDSELIHDFGGMITFTPDFLFRSGKVTKAEDAKLFYKAIADYIGK